MSESDTTSIVNLLIDKMVEHATSEMKDLVWESTELGLVRSGRLQADPLIAKLNLLIREGGKDWPDIIKPENYRIRGATFQMGGGELWLRRFMAQYHLYYIGTATRDEARTSCNIILARFKKIIYEMGLGMQDTFGETAILCSMVEEERSEGGGPAKSFIWRCKQRFEFLTETE
jgi:hypothetical protein